jgi:hypothetical protein
MGLLDFSLPSIGELVSLSDPKIRQALSDIKDVINGELDDTNIDSDLLASLGYSSDALKRRDVISIDTEETTSSSSFTTLTTPDIVENIVVPEGGILFIHYQALWKSAVNGANVFAAPFINGTQLNFGVPGAVPTVQQAQDNKGFWMFLYSSCNGGGLMSEGEGTGHSSFGASPLGLTNLAGVPVIADAGTYDIDIRFKAAGGTSVSVKERKLAVYTQIF